MADMTSRSRFRITVRNRDDLMLHFPFSKLNAVETYRRDELRQQ